jgi:hypothetical protein
MSTLNITPEKIRQAANECPEAAKTLKTLFPEAFENENEFYYFEDEVLLNTFISEKPLFIGKNFAPEGMSGKCLMVDTSYEMETIVYAGRTVLYFKKK